MNNIVTFEQAKKLKDIGFNAEVHRYFLYERLISSDDYNWNGINEIHCSAPTVSEAIDYLRQDKGIACGVHPFAIYEDMPDGDQHFIKWGYRYVAFKGLSEWQDMNKDVFDTHHLASSALLTAVLDYLEKGGEECIKI